MSTIIHRAANWYSANNIRYVLIDGNTCTRLTDCYTVLQQQLDIPDYFGKNLDALEEVLADLEWIPEEKIKITILHPAVLLAEEEDKKNDFLSIMNTCENERVEVMYAVTNTPFKG
jgi:RNAse (barnase) inhibitor barstar